MEFRQLKYFIQIAKDKNYTLAAKHLYITQPTLSWTIKQLEEELTIKLFDTNKKKLNLTSNGEEFYKYANNLLQEHNEIIDLYQNRTGELTGKIHLGVPVLFGSTFFSEPVIGFMNKYPKVKITMTNSGSINVQNMVEKGIVDLGIVSYLFPTPDLEAIRLPHQSYPIVAVVNENHRFANKKSITFSDLRNEKLILLPEEYTVGELAYNACKAEGFSPDILFRISDWSMICKMIEGSNIMSILPLPVINNLQYTHLKVIPMDIPETTVPIAIICKRTKAKSLIISEFIKYALDNIT